MPRKSIAPWSERVAEGLIDQPINSNITTGQTLRPTVDTGFIDQLGIWKGNISSDSIFDITQTDIGVANSATIISPSGNADGTWALDMTGYEDIQIAIKPTQGGNYAIEAVMASGGFSYGNLSPVNAAVSLRGLFVEYSSVSNHMNDAFNDAAESLTADVWNIFMIKAVLSNQKLLQFKITNNSGGSSDIETAFMRVV